MSQSYEFVPFLDMKEFGIGKKGLSKSLLEYEKISLQIQTITHIHIWSGMYSEKDGVIYKTFIKSNGSYIIPGSSLKGCVRSIAEMVSNSCMGVKVDKEFFKKMPTNKEHSKNKACIVCDMFGAPGRKSKVIFCDFKPEITSDSSDIAEIIPIPSSNSPHIESQNYYNKEGKLIGYKIYKHIKEKTFYEKSKENILIEAIPPGVVFKGDIFFRSDLTDEQKGLLLFSLGLGGYFLKIGYGKNYFLGSVKVQASNITQNLLNLIKNYENNAGKDIKKNIRTLKKILRFDN